MRFFRSLFLLSSGSIAWTKRSSAQPASPDSIAKAARTQWQTSPVKMKRHEVGDFPKYFKYHRGKLHFVLDDFIEGLSLKPEPYAPILQVMSNGRLRYVDVTPYNMKWLPKDTSGRRLEDSQRVRFEPALVWTEDRWIFCRRMAGDNLCQRLFYELAIFIWRANGIEGE